jgi:Flp pilus assembly protein TadD
MAYAHDAGNQGACAAARPIALVDARESVQRAPRALNARLGLADLLIEAGCYEEAVHVLTDGEPMHPRNEALQSRLRFARSLVSEHQFFQGLEKVELEARLTRHVMRCTRFDDVSACDQALELKPDDSTIMTAKGAALLKADKPLDALEIFRRAAALEPENPDIIAKVKTAQAVRAMLEERCMSAEGETGVSACRSILAKGGPVEFEVTRRIAVLQQTSNQHSKALDTYIAAHSLRRGDKAVATAIVALVDSTGRGDAVALAARGSSLVTLGRARDALVSMRQAQALSPGLPGIDDRILAAENMLRRDKPLLASQTAQSSPPTAAVVSAAPAHTYSNLQPASHSN